MSLHSPDEYMLYFTNQKQESNKALHNSIFLETFFFSDFNKSICFYSVHFDVLIAILLGKGKK